MRYRSLRLLSLLAACAALAPLHAQGRKLNLPLALTDNVGDVTTFRVSPDGAWVAFRIDQSEDEVHELWAAPSDQSAPAVRLHGALPPGGDVAEFPGFEISSLNRVVFVADALQDGIDELFSVPIDASAPPVRLSGGTNPDSDVVDFEISPNGLRVVYRAKLPLALAELFSAPSDGSQAPLELADGSGECKGIYLSPDSTRVVAWFGTSLVSQAIDGLGAALTLAPLSPALQLSLTFTPNGQRVVYWNSALRAVPVNASAPAVTLSTTAFLWRILPGGTQVLAGGGTRLDVLPITGGSGLQLASLPAGENVQVLELTPAGSTVLFGTGSTSVSVNALYRVPVNGSQSPTALPGSWSAIQGGFTITPDSTTMLVRDESGGDEELDAVSIQGSFAPRVLGSSFRNDIQVELLAGGTTALWHGNEQLEAFDLSELYRRPIDASLPATRLDTDTGGGVKAFALADAGQRLVYLDQDARNNVNDPRVHQLHGMPLDASAAPERFNGPLPSGLPVLGDVHSFAASRTGDVAIYVADVTLVGRTELFAVHPFSTLGTLRLSPPLPGGEFVFPEIALGSDGALAAFRTGRGAGLDNIWCAPTDGSGPARLLASVDLPFGTRFEFTPDGSRIVFAGPRQLVTVRSDGSQLPLFFGPLGLAVREFELSADGARVLFLGDLGTVDALYSAPVDGSSAAVRLVPAGPSTQDILEPEIEGGLVYYRSDPTSNLFELFAVALDGSSLPVRLNPPLVSGGDVEEFAVSPAGGGLVVYRADQSVNDQFELLRVLAPGSSLSLVPLPATADVSSGFVLGSDGQQVYYRANTLFSNRFELFRAATDGSAAPVYIPVDSFHASLSEFRLSPDEQTVAFRIASQTLLRHMRISGGPAVSVGSGPATYGFSPDSRSLIHFVEGFQNPGYLKSAPLRGGPIRILESTPFSGDESGEIRSFLAQNQGRVFYLGDGETLGVDELFLGFTERVRNAPGAPPPPGAPRLGF